MFSTPVPTGYIWVVRDMVCAQAASPLVRLNGFDIEVWDGEIVVGYLWLNEPALGNTHYHWRGRQVLYAGETIRAYSEDEAPWYLMVMGYALTAP